MAADFAIDDLLICLFADLIGAMLAQVLSLPGLRIVFIKLAPQNSDPNHHIAITSWLNCGALN